ncbi:hypothetical protein CC99x_001810 [Candidatus Berkiella cookevillensis]|uniref:Lipoprotein n=1 Tax=Candidatus Berkiella cookevillensis TaxID=437022 RepID=A0A0Q9YGF0_9GAMM|nr:hypothetical protein [Candidatus Berkiella cookevillensis]MCS5707634.1 hypothetical protein [Candidatus Berkiella cookevillensis]
MKKISLAIVVAMIVCTMNACSHLRKENTASAQSQSASQPKKSNSISKWLFQKEPAHYSESYDRGVYRVRDRK